MFNDKKSLLQILLSLLFFSALLLPVLVFETKGIRKPFLWQYISFNDYFSIIDSLLRLFLILVLAIYCFGLGNYLAKKYNFHLPPSFLIGIGVILINILLLPLFFLKLFYLPILLLFFLILNLPAVKGLLDAFKMRTESFRFEGRQILLVLLVTIVPLGIHLVSALTPVDFSESYGDIANTYLNVPMSFAASHGAVHTYLLAGPIQQLVNFDLMSSALVVLSNPEIIKIFGYLLFVLTFFILLDFLHFVLRFSWSLWLSLLLLISPFFIERSFSFAHPRVYVMFLSSFSLFLTYIGHQQKESKYHFLALIPIGLLAGTNYQGVLCALLNLILLFSNFKLLRKNLKKYLLFSTFTFILALIFPLWIYFYQGSPFPKSPLFNKIFGFQVKEDMVNSWVTERPALQLVTSHKITISSYFFNIIKVIFAYTGPLSVFFIIGILFLRKWTVRFFLFYYLTYALILMVLFPNSMEGGVHSRFQHIILPFLLVFLFYIIKCSSAWLKSYLSKKYLSALSVIRERRPSGSTLGEILSLTLLRYFFLLFFIFTSGYIQFLQEVMMPKGVFVILFLIFSSIIFLLSKTVFLPWQGILLKNLPFYLRIRKKHYWLWSAVSSTLVPVITSALSCVFLFLFITQSPFLFSFLRVSLVSLWRGVVLFRWFLLPVYFIPIDFLLVSLARQWHLITKITKAKAAELFANTYVNLIVAFFIFLSVFRVSIQSLEILTKDKYKRFPRQLAFIGGQIDLMNFFNKRDVEISEYFNKNLSSEDKLLYFFHPQGIYTKPQLYQANSIALASIVYRSSDTAVIMNKLKTAGIGFLCLDNKWGIYADSPFLSMVADITTPILEPDFFARHFISMETKITDLYFFKIDYDGLEDQSEIEANFERTVETGFFRFIYESIDKNRSGMIEIKENPYKVETLFSKYEEVKERLCLKFY